MKIKVLGSVVLAAIFFLGPLASARDGGNSVGNGGDKTALQFTWTARRALSFLKGMSLSAERRRQVQLIEAAVNTVQVGSAERLKLRGLEVDAINYVEKKKIVVSRSGWRRMMRSSSPVRFGFVLHEYARVAGLESEDQYDVSYNLTSLLRDGRRIDDNDRELILENLLSIQNELLKFEAQAGSPALKASADFVRMTCREAGRLNQAGVTLDILMRVTPMNFGPQPREAIDTLFEAAKELERQCFNKHAESEIILRSLQRALEAIKSVRSSGRQ